MDVFLSSPMSSLPAHKIKTVTDDCISIISVLKILSVDRVFCAAILHDGQENYDSPRQALLQDLTDVSRVDKFIMYMPEVSLTGAFVEVGYAMGKKIPCLILTPDRLKLPYFLREDAEEDRLKLKLVLAEFRPPLEADLNRVQTVLADFLHGDEG